MRVHDIEREQRDVRRLEHVAAGVEHEIRPLVASAAAASAFWPSRASNSSSSCMREMWVTSRATLRKSSTPCLRCSRGSFLPRAMVLRAIASMKRGLTP